MSKENKSPKSKVTLFTLIVCVIAVLSGKPISEVISDVSTAQETVTVEESYDYEDNLEETEVSEEANLQDSSVTEATTETEFADTEAAAEIEEADTQEEALTEDTDAPKETSDEEENTQSETQETSDDEEIAFSEPEVEISDHTFRSKKLLNDHYKKHGLEMGFDSAEEYVENANRVISSPDVLYKLEEEDNDHVYYLEETNEFVVVSQDGYIRTYFNPSAGIDYFNRQ